MPGFHPEQPHAAIIANSATTANLGPLQEATTPFRHRSLATVRGMALAGVVIAGMAHWRLIETSIRRAQRQASASDRATGQTEGARP
jgi:hypothetical protein